MSALLTPIPLLNATQLRGIPTDTAPRLVQSFDSDAADRTG
jgi:hypothetical protein